MLQVCIEGVWVPVDCACGSGMVAPYLKYQHTFMPQYFAVNPEHFIFSHIPVKSEFQLLQESVSLAYISPLISPSVLSLSLGVEPLSWAETLVIDRDSPSTTIKVPVRVPSNMRLSATLREATDLTPDKNQNKTSDSQCQATFIQAKENSTVDIYALIPGNGTFFLGVNVHKDNDTIPCFSYQVNCLTEPAPYAGFPTVYDLPSVAFRFKPLYWNTPKAANVCENDEGKMDLVFQCRAGTQFYHCLLPGNKSSQLVDLDSQHFCTAITRDITDHSLYKLNVVFPATGWWTVYLCATKKTGDQVSGYTALFHFPVFVRKELHKCTYPHVHSPDIHFQLEEPISSGGKDLLTVPFFSTQDLKLHSMLCFEDPDGVQYQEYTLTRPLEGLNERGEYKYLLQVIFPKPGKWYVRVYANSAEELQTDGYLSLFDLFIDVDNCLKCAIFPIMDQDVMKKCDIHLLHPDYLVTLNKVSKQTPLLRFIAPNRVTFDHYVEPTSHSPGNGSTEALFHRHFTYLSAVENMGTESRYELKAVFPKIGNWIIVLSAAETSLSNKKVALRVIVKDINFPPETGDVRIFPVLHPSFSEFGISFSADKIPYPKLCSSPEFHIEFQSVKSVNFAWTFQDIQCKRQMPLSTNVFLETSKETQGGKSLRKLRVVFPKPGTWLIQVVARNVLTDIVSDNTLSLSLHYQPVFDLIVEASNAALCRMSFPRIHESFHSPFGLHIDSSDLPLPSQIYQLPTTCKIRFYSPPGVLFWHHCTESSQLQDRKITRMISYAETGLHELCADISKRGQWTVYLHAKLQDDTSKTWTAVLQHSIVAKSSKFFSSSSSLQYP